MLRKLGQAKAAKPGAEKAGKAADESKKPKVLSTSQAKYQTGNAGGMHPSFQGPG